MLIVRTENKQFFSYTISWQDLITNDETIMMFQLTEASQPVQLVCLSIQTHYLDSKPSNIHSVSLYDVCLAEKQ